MESNSKVLMVMHANRENVRLYAESGICFFSGTEKDMSGVITMLLLAHAEQPVEIGYMKNINYDLESYHRDIDFETWWNQREKTK
jgi:hypothetical protein